MITELDLLHVLKKKADYGRFKPLIKEHAVTDRVLKIITDMEVYFKIDNKDEVDWSSFSSWFKLVKNPSMKKSEMDIYDTIFDNLNSFTPTQTTEAIVKHFIALDYAGRMMQELDNLVAGKHRDLLFVEGLFTDYLDEVKLSLPQDEEFYSSHELSKILDSTIRSGGFEWKLEDLNVGIGPLHKGDFIIVATRPEVGKTTFAIDQTMHMIQQASSDEVLLWVNNEEDGNRLMLRAYQSVLNKDLMELLKDEKTAQNSFIKALKGNISRIRIYDKPGATVQDIERQCKKYQPKIIVFNVMDKIQGFGEEGNEAERLRKLFQWGRELAKRYGIVFALAQADGSAEGQKYIYQDQLYGSKTGVQGEADVIITIGAVHDPKRQHERYIHVPKNKLPGGTKTDPSQKHGYFDVLIDPDKATFKSIKYGAKGGS